MTAVFGFNLVTVEDVCSELKIPLKQAYDFVQKLPPGIVVKVGRRVRVNSDALGDWLRAGGDARLKGARPES